MDDAVGVVQGSAVKGRSFETREAFDVGRPSGFDVGLASRQLLRRAELIGIKVKGGGTRTGPLTPDDVSRLGLGRLRKQLSERAGRPVNFRIYDTVESATARDPSIVVPR